MSSAREPDAWERKEAPVGGTTPRDFERNPQRRLRRLIERWIAGERAGEIRSVLDVACNAGIEAWRLRAAGYRGLYAGIDRNRKALAAARENLSGLGEVFFARSDARKLPFRDRTFDCVLVKDLLEHLEDYREALAEAARTARRWIVVGLFIPLGRREKIRRGADGYFLNRYAREPFLEFLRGLGFGQIRTRTILRLWAREQVVLAERTSEP